jgi:hypothetical protein
MRRLAEKHLESVYGLLRNLNLVKSQQDFSRHYLGTSDRYYAMLRASGRSPSAKVLANLAGRLRLLKQDLGARFLSQHEGASDQIDQAARDTMHMLVWG